MEAVTCITSECDHCHKLNWAGPTAKLKPAHRGTMGTMLLAVVRCGDEDHLGNFVT